MFSKPEHAPVATSRQCLRLRRRAAVESVSCCGSREEGCSEQANPPSPNHKPGTTPRVPYQKRCSGRHSGSPCVPGSATAAACCVVTRCRAGCRCPRLPAPGHRATTSARTPEHIPQRRCTCCMKAPSGKSWYVECPGGAVPDRFSTSRGGGGFFADGA